MVKKVLTNIALTFLLTFIVRLITLFWSAHNTKMAEELSLSTNDPSSYSRPDLVITTKLHLSLTVDFSRHTLSGLVKVKGTRIDAGTNELILDIKGLTIFYIHDTLTGQNLDYTIGEQFKDIGSKLTINIQQCQDNFEITIGYETSPSASGLQWLTPKQTSGKVHPFMFSQGEPIEMRSILPCQDTPSVKVPYTADIRAPKPLTVLMSALRSKTTIDLLDDTRIHVFNQPIGIPSYLIAIAVGELESRNLGPRSDVWAEPSIVDAAQYEFVDTEKMLQTAESICGPYVWGQYDLLVLPPSFPFGGMENPCLTFLTPTLLAGDRSLVNVIAHEIAHSWTGNLVTNANFNHFWLNEGFTVFVERKIVSKIEGNDLRDFLTIVGVTELKDTIDSMGKSNVLTKLVVDLRGVHPDDAFSTVPYEKGSIFLRYLEQLVGGPDTFEKFLVSYLKTFEYKSIVTDDFKKYFLKYFPSEEIHSKIDWDGWLYTPGMPILLPELDQTIVEKIAAVANQWIEYNKNETKSDLPQDLSSYTTEEMNQFLNKLIEDEALTIRTLKSMNDLYKMDEKKNCEIRSRWLRLCIRGRWEEKISSALEFVNTYGRMKYLNPIYRELYNADGKFRQEALTNYDIHKDEMMMVAQKSVARALNLV